MRVSTRSVEAWSGARVQCCPPGIARWSRRCAHGAVGHNVLAFCLTIADFRFQIISFDSVHWFGLPSSGRASALRTVTKLEAAFQLYALCRVDRLLVVACGRCRSVDDFSESLAEDLELRCLACNLECVTIPKGFKLRCLFALCRQALAQDVGYVLSLIHI